MKEFYEGLAKEANVAAALRKAQLRMLRETVWGLPAHWASFRLTGRIENPLQ